MASYVGLTTAQRQPAADPDADGLSNAVEYVLDLHDPTVADAWRLPRPVVTGGNAVYALSLRANTQRASYFVEWLNSLAAPGATFTTGVELQGRTLRVTRPLEDGETLFRLNVRLETAAVPTDNPITARYGQIYNWTDALAWGTVVNILDHGGIADGVWNPATFDSPRGTDNSAALTAAMNALPSSGGVVYFPPGIYYFANHVQLRNGVILRGATPTMADAKVEGYDPPSKLVFPKYYPLFSGEGRPNDTAFKIITSQNPKTDSNQGIIHLDINRAGIMLDGFDNQYYSAPGNTGAYLSEFTRQNTVVFGIRSNNTARAQKSEGLPSSGVPFLTNPVQNAWDRWTFQFTANVRIASGGFAFIGNNRCNDLSARNQWSTGEVGQPEPVYFDDSFDQIGYIMRHTRSADGFPDSPPRSYVLNRKGQATFRMSDGYGISLNGLYHAGKASGTPNGWYGNPAIAPHLFRLGHAVRDNFIYGNEGARMEASGDGLEIIGNVMRDDPKKICWTGPAGNGTPAGTHFRSRTALIGGQNILTWENDLEGYRHRIGSAATNAISQFQTNDGEGLMMDNTKSVTTNWEVRNNRLTSCIFSFFGRDIRGALVSGNVWVVGPQHAQSNGGIPIWFEADTDAQNLYVMENARIENNRNMPGLVIMVGRAGGSGNTFIGNSTDGRAAEFRYNPANGIEVRNNTGYTSVIRP